MVSYLASLALVYVLGGVTFVPLVILVVFYFSRWYLPKVDDEPVDVLEDEVPDFDNETFKSDKSPGEIDDTDGASGLFEQDNETGVDTYMTGWVTVSREYFIYPTGGSRNTLNPPQPAANDASMSQTESAYSSLYKLITNSKNSQSPAQTPSTTPSDAPAAEDRKPKKSLSKLSKYYAVLKHGNILLYADADEATVKHVIVIAHHVVTLWPPNVPDGELFIKRSAICLVKRDSQHGLEAMVRDPSRPPKDAFFLYTDDCSTKEDLYFALIRASKRRRRPTASSANSFTLEGADRYLDPLVMAKPLHYKTDEIMDLILTLHSSDANIQTRWFNALLGRIFLAVKGTPAFEGFFRDKIVKKLSRVKRPTFLSEIEVRKISSGDSIPYLTNPKLRDLTPEGVLTIEANVSYAGNFSVEIGTKAIINLGSRFKSREVSLVLAATVKNLEGKLIFKIKPPPTNRIWYAFETTPKLNLLIEPVVSSRQITYSMVTKAIENRIREVIKETLVLPYMDDLTFFSTAGEFYRGGIWDPSNRPKSSASPPESPTSDPEHPMARSQSTSDAFPLSISTATETPDSPSTLRHRHTTGSVDSNLPVDSDTVSELDLDVPSPLQSSQSTTYNPSDHIGELKGFGYTPESHSAGPAQATKNLVGMAKKWGTWYFKDRRNDPMSDGPSTRRSIAEPSVGQVPAADDGSRSPSRNDSEAKPKHAPMPHNFPPEMMNMINNGASNGMTSKNPYGPTPEMRVPVGYPVPEAVPPPTTALKRKPTTGEIQAAVADNDGPSRDQNPDTSYPAEKAHEKLLATKELDEKLESENQESEKSPEWNADQETTDDETFKIPDSSILSRSPSSQKQPMSRRMSSVSVKTDPLSNAESLSFHPSPPTTATTKMSAINLLPAINTASDVPVVDTTTTSVTGTMAPVTYAPASAPAVETKPDLPPRPTSRQYSVKRKKVGSGISTPRSKLDELHNGLESSVETLREVTPESMQPQNNPPEG